MTTLVDSNVLLDVLTDDPQWFAWSSDALAEALDRGRLVINPIIYSEVSIGFERVEELEAVLSPDAFTREDLPWAAGFLAGKAFLQYRRNGGTSRSPLPDFYIGAHAATHRYRLLSRDRGRYASYFPTVELVSPA